MFYVHTTRQIRITREAYVHTTREIRITREVYVHTTRRDNAEGKVCNGKAQTTLPGPESSEISEKDMAATPSGVDCGSAVSLLRAAEPQAKISQTKFPHCREISEPPMQRGGRV